MNVELTQVEIDIILNLLSQVNVKPTQENAVLIVETVQSIVKKLSQNPNQKAE